MWGSKKYPYPPIWVFSGLSPTQLGFTLQRASCYTLHMVTHFMNETFILFNFNLVTNQPNEILQSVIAVHGYKYFRTNNGTETIDFANIFDNSQLPG